MKLTKQGVRDLSHLKAPANKKYEPPPASAFECKHDRTRTDGLSGDIFCQDCDAAWDWNGKPYET